MSAPAAAALPALRIERETLADDTVVAALVLRAFGPGRFARTAERLRERSRLAAGFVARDGEQVVGSVRLWAIMVAESPALFLGPIAVDGDRRRSGLGADLVQACVDYARGQAVSGVLLVGEPWFTRFGFVTAPRVNLPGPVDRRRLFWLPVTGEAVPEGAVRAVS